MKNSPAGTKGLTRAEKKSGPEPGSVGALVKNTRNKVQNTRRMIAQSKELVSRARKTVELSKSLQRVVEKKF